MDRIEKGIYQGYIWYSDQTKPEVYDDEYFDGIELDDNKNPFIIEAQMYETEKEVSYGVKYVDGGYICKKYVLTDDDLANITRKEFYPNRMDKITGKKLVFKQCWKAEGDPMCEGMEVLQPAELVFVGFTEKEDKK